MKKIFQLTILLALTGIFTECKKGEDDPGISFRRRKARVVGEWTQTSGTSLSTSVNGGNSNTTTYTYAESTATRNYVSGAVNTTTTYPYSFKITFESDGTFTYTETESTSIVTASGVWNFTGRVGDEYKNKEQIVLTFNSSTSTDVGYNATGTWTGKDITTAFTIKELRNKKMVITSNSTSASNNSSSTYSSESVLEQ